MGEKINETTTGCGPCPYLSNNGECNWAIKCSHNLSYTYTNIDALVDIRPVPYMGPNYTYIGQAGSDNYIMLPKEDNND